MPRSRAYLIASVLGLTIVIQSLPARAQGWLDPAWPHRLEVEVDNTAGPMLTDHQVELALGAPFPFGLVGSDGSDLRFTDTDGVSLLDYWIEEFDASSGAATLWIRVPQLPANSVSTLYVYFGNPSAVAVSDGDATFLFFDDFETDPLGYFALGPAETALVQDLQWEGRAPHTMSVIERNELGFQYWGYYALQGGFGGVGLAFSNDLSNWTKHVHPLFTNGRWATVLGEGPRVHMMVTKDFPTTSHIVYRLSLDGATFTEVETVVPPQAGIKNQNPHLFFNDQDGQYYLFWFRNTGVFEIWAKTANAITDLDLAPEVLLLSSPAVLAAPHMMYYDGTYFLAVETFENSSWTTRVFASDQILTGFEPLAGNPLLNDGDACFFQHIFGDEMHAYYCKLIGSTWTLEHRAASLLAGRVPILDEVDPKKWQALGGTWSRTTATGPRGQTTKVAQGVTSAVETLRARFESQDYVVEAWGRLLSGRVWGLNARVNGLRSLYTSNLYEDLDATDNLYLYRFIPGAPTTTLAQSAVGSIALGDWHEMTLAVNGSSLSVDLDAQPIHSGIDSTFAAGSPGLYGEAGTTAQFDDVRVRRYADPEPLATVVPEPGVASAGGLGVMWLIALRLGGRGKRGESSLLVRFARR